MSDFAEVFGQPHEVLAQAPGRVNLLGEHTDYNDGYVLPTAIPQQTTVSLRRNGTAEFVAHAADLDRQVRFGPEEPPSEPFAKYLYGCIRGVEGMSQPVPGLDIHVSSQVPMGVGLSSSAALEVAMLRALRQLLALTIDDVAIARMAQRAEIDYAGVQCGIMDQMASSLADASSMLFLDTRTLERKLLPLPGDTALLVLDSGISRSLADTAYNQRRAECEQAAAKLGVASLRDIDDITIIESLPEPLRRRARHVITENARVLRASKGVDASAFGELMNASHQSLRDDFEVSVPPLDLLVQLLQQHPAVHGARLTGAGFGGACVALCRAGQAEHIATDAGARYREQGHVARTLVPVASTAPLQKAG
ncbi:MAG: galactokinase [Pseudomonadota bacterium]|nr:galactokinase [Pseudomonadota bacterium]